ncbi:MAG: 3-phosphoshikimate 1-carboxyvinyltransferase [Dehalococcoidia bacterium]|nr:3-phosphoshikimate 1-carboxyvinyltransferase [Dehalococcoidia bacterium]
MKVLICKSEAHGILDAPSSKSYTIRALMCAALSPGQSYIRHALASDDTLAACDVLQSVGISVWKSEYGWRVSGGTFKRPDGELFCRNSAATLRFMAAIAALVPGTIRLVPGEGLAKRPVEPLVCALSQLGVECRLDGPVVLVEGGNFPGGNVEMPGDISSQFISAILMAGSLSQKGVSIRLSTALASRPYVDMTMECLKKFGVRVSATPSMDEFSVAKQEYRPTDLTIEGDWSQASYFMALGILCGESITTNLNAESLQGDRVALALMQRMGARFSVRRSSVMAQKSYLHGINADLSNCIDLLPTLAVLAAVADGSSCFSNIQAARLKESNRVEALCQELHKMGIRTREEENSLTVIGGQPHGAEIDSHADHRLAMAFGVLGCAVGETVIHGAECVDKTYPKFWQALASLGAKVESNDE